MGFWDSEMLICVCLGNVGVDIEGFREGIWGYALNMVLNS